MLLKAFAHNSGEPYIAANGNPSVDKCPQTTAHVLQENRAMVIAKASHGSEGDPHLVRWMPGLNGQEETKVKTTSLTNGPSRISNRHSQSLSPAFCSRSLPRGQNRRWRKQKGWILLNNPSRMHQKSILYTARKNQRNKLVAVFDSARSSLNIQGGLPECDGLSFHKQSVRNSCRARRQITKRYEYKGTEAHLPQFVI